MISSKFLTLLGISTLIMPTLHCSANTKASKEKPSVHAFQTAAAGAAASSVMRATSPVFQWAQRTPEKDPFDKDARIFSIWGKKTDSAAASAAGEPAGDLDFCSLEFEMNSNCGDDERKADLDAIADFVFFHDEVEWKRGNEGESAAAPARRAVPSKTAKAVEDWFSFEEGFIKSSSLTMTEDNKRYTIETRSSITHVDKELYDVVRKGNYKVIITPKVRIK